MKDWNVVALLVIALILGLLFWPSTPSAPRDSDSVAAQSAAMPAQTSHEPAGDIDDVPEPSPEPSAREEIAPAAEPPAIASPAAPLLRVHVLAKEDHAPLRGVRLALHEVTNEPRSRCENVERAHARPGECPTTDANGWAEFEAESGPRYRVVSLDWDLESAVLEVPPLAAGEQREVTLELRTQDDVTLFGVLLDAESGAPVSDGMLLHDRAESGDVATADATAPDNVSRAVRAGPDGKFELRGKSWKRDFVQASAPGYARTLFLLAAGHSDPAALLEVRLSREAAAEVVVSDAAGGPVSGVRVELSTHMHELVQGGSLLDFLGGIDPMWSARTDARGSALFEKLVPRVPLKVVLRSANSEPREEAQPVVLEPGERRRIEIRLGTGGVVQGQVLDEHGAPLAGRKIWRVLHRESEPMLSLVFNEYETPASTTQTDEQGRFRFDDVAIGQWSVGLAPPDWREHETSEYPAYAEVVEVKSADAVVDLILRVHANLFVRGTLLDPQGRPVDNWQVFGRQKGSWMQPSTRTDAAGAFALGPLQAGTWSLETYNGGDFAPTEPVMAEAGGEPVVLQFRVGASISGRLVGSDGNAPGACEMLLAPADPDVIGASMRQSQGDRFEFKGLLPGKYVITARDRAGAIGMTPAIELASGQVDDTRVIRLAQGARLRVRFEGPRKYCNFRLLSGGMTIASDQVQAGKVADKTVPAGSVEVRWGWKESAKSLVLQLAPGEVKEVVLDDTP